MNLKFKDYAMGIFYTLGVIGIVDMSIQATTQGQIKPIRIVLQWIFG